jgi:hypothetical protein
MKKMALALGVGATIAVAGVAVPVAEANAGLHLSVSPAKPSAGQTIKMHATGAVKNGRYVCITALTHKGVKEQASISNANNVVTDAKSSKKGVVNCQLSFLPFSKPYHGKTHHCPPTKKDKRAGWGCGAAVANFNNHKQFVIKKFKF